MKRIICVALLAATTACNSNSGPEEATTPTGGKGDTFQTETKECTFASPWEAETSADLQEFAGEESRFTEEDIDSLDEVTANQLFEAVVILEFLNESERFDLLFSADDEGEMTVIELDIDGTAYDWIKFHAGDTEVGVIFEDDTTDVVAEVSDGDLVTCEIVLGPLMTTDPICSFDQEWRAETSAELLESLRSTQDMDVLDAVLSLHKRQIVRAMLHLELIEENDDIFDAFKAVDDERMTVTELEFEDGLRFDWVRASAGDTEVGVVFDSKGTLPIAEISDGDVMGCTTLVPDEP